jgi:C4-dicarboxylate-specific signal transduction histidine kinase
LLALGPSRDLCGFWSAVAHLLPACIALALVTFVCDAMNDVAGPCVLDIKPQHAENEQLFVSVSDNGVGMPALKVDQIFHAFFGRSIVEAHGGPLRIADNSPRGPSIDFALLTSVEAHQ